MKYSIAHPTRSMNHFGQSLFPDGKVPWREAIPPDLSKTGEDRRTVGVLAGCDYCGSMNPTDLADAIKAGAVGEWADMKYGWPHKSYWLGIPNPHAGMLESRSGANFPAKGYIQVSENRWEAPGTPAPSTTDGKFYTVHLRDATPEEKDIIEKALGITFTFSEDGKVSWKAYKE